MTTTMSSMSSPFGWNGGNRLRREGSKQDKNTFIRRKRVPKIDGTTSDSKKDKPFYSDWHSSSSASSSTTDIVLPPTSSDLELNNKSYNEGILFNPLNTYNPTIIDDEDQDDTMTISPHTPLARTFNLDNIRKEDETIYLCTRKTIVSRAPVLVESEKISFNDLPLIAKQNPTHKLSWSRRTSEHAIIETYLPPTCGICLNKLEERSKQYQDIKNSLLFSPVFCEDRLQSPPLSTPSSPISSGTSSASSTADFSPYQNSMNEYESRNERWGIAI